MIKHSVRISDKEAYWYEISSKGEPAHFYHANGFPLPMYAKFLDRLKDKFSLSSLVLRAQWPEIGTPPKKLRWHTYGDDLIDYLEKTQSEPVVGIGHSMGATATLFAAVKRPDLFKSLILIEPASVSMLLANMDYFLPYGLRKYIEPIKGTLKKRDKWETKEEFLKEYGNQRFYNKMDDKTVSKLVVKNINGGYILDFPKIWEAHNYACPPNLFRSIKSVKVPVSIVKGKPSVFFTKSIMDKWKGLRPEHKWYEEFDFGHMFPIEAPEYCGELVNKIV